MDGDLILSRLPSPGSLLVAAGLVLLAGLLATLDTALSRISQTRAAELVVLRRRGASALVEVAADSASALGVATLLRVFAESGAAVSIAWVVASSIGMGGRGWLTATLIVAVVSFVVVWVAARTLGRQHAETVALLAAPTVLRLRRVLGPVARTLVIAGNVITPGEGYRHGPFDSEAHLRDLLDLAGESAVIEADEHKMIHSVFDLGDTIVREVMVPRTDLVVIDRQVSLPEAMRLFLDSGFSRLPVTGEDSDDIVGMAFLKDVAAQLHLEQSASLTASAADVMRPAWFVPDSKPVDDLMREMQRARTHAAIVVDEYGGTAGMVTIEDILEEIVGELTDEHDQETPEVEQIAPEHFRVAARCHIEHLGELFGLPLEDDEVDTVGGLLAKGLGRVPVAGSSTQIGGLILTADRFGGRRRTLLTVMAQRAPQPEDEE